MPLFQTNEAAKQSGLLGPGVENDPAQSELGLLGTLKGLPQGLLDTAMIPGERFQGRGTPSVEDAVALSGLMGGGGLLAGRPASSLGVFGGKARHPAGPPKFMDVGNETGMISQPFKTKRGGEGLTVAKLRKQDDNTIGMDLSFAVKNPKTGELTIDPVGLTARQGGEVVTAAVNEFKNLISKTHPSQVTFRASEPRLLGVYHKLAKQLADETDGTFLPPLGNNPNFRITLPNAQVFKSTGKGLLDPQ